MINDSINSLNYGIEIECHVNSSNDEVVRDLKSIDSTVKWNSGYDCGGREFKTIGSLSYEQMLTTLYGAYNVLEKYGAYSDLELGIHLHVSHDNLDLSSDPKFLEKFSKKWAQYEDFMFRVCSRNFSEKEGKYIHRQTMGNIYTNPIVSRSLPFNKEERTFLSNMNTRLVRGNCVAKRGTFRTLEFRLIDNSFDEGKSFDNAFRLISIATMIGRFVAYCLNFEVKTINNIISPKDETKKYCKKLWMFLRQILWVDPIIAKTLLFLYGGTFNNDERCEHSHPSQLKEHFKGVPNYTSQF